MINVCFLEIGRTKANEELFFSFPWKIRFCPANANDFREHAVDVAHIIGTRT